jgi:hypothetical protein
MKNQLIAGIDYSLCCPSICVFEIEDGKNFCFRNCAFFFLTEIECLTGQILPNIRGERFEDWQHDCERYDSIAEWTCDKVRACFQVALEDYAFSANGRIFNIAENTGILKYKLWQNSIPIDVISPTHIKRMATGKGNADKEKMLEFFNQECGINIKDRITPGRKNLGSPVTDIVDSYYICKVLYSRLKGLPMQPDNSEPDTWTPEDSS